jgi:hypothetical protein
MLLSLRLDTSNCAQTKSAKQLNSQSCTRPDGRRRSEHRWGSHLISFDQQQMTPRARLNVRAQLHHGGMRLQQLVLRHAHDASMRLARSDLSLT